jgi:hypothetical protein
MRKSPSLFGGLSKEVQNLINKIIPEKVHNALTTAIKQMTRCDLWGRVYEHEIPQGVNLDIREHLVRKQIKFYRNTAAAEEVVTGAAGFLVGLADFPIWLTLKMKMLFEIARIYGFDVKNYKERIYILHIFHSLFPARKTETVFSKYLKTGT